MFDSDRVRDVFRDAGLRWTPQRQAVADALRGRRSHPTAEEIFRVVRRRHPGMARATVYNTLDVLAATGLITMLHSDRGTRRYDPNTSAHHHLRCDRCGRIADLPADRVPAHTGLARLRAGGFKVTGFRIEFHGYCSKCDGRQ